MTRYERARLREEALYRGRAYLAVARLPVSVVLADGRRFAPIVAAPSRLEAISRARAVAMRTWGAAVAVVRDAHRWTAA